MSFSDQVAVVTGASSGIGEALAIQLAQSGASVGLIARREERLQQLAQTIHDSGGKAVYAVADIGQRASVSDAFAHIREQLGEVDLLIANAGTGKPVTLSPFNIEDMEQIMRVNYLGMLYSIEAVLPSMLERKKGQICGISSLAAFKGMPGEQAYSASKAAVTNFLEGLRLHLRSEGIAVTTVHPGFVRTEMTEHFASLPLAWTAEKAARKILRAISRRKKVYSFPWLLTYLIKQGAWLPDWIVARLVQRFTATKKEKPVA